MPAQYQLADIRPILPFTSTEDYAPFTDKADAGGGHVFYLADERGLWLHIPDDERDDETFEAITGFGKHELRHMRMGDLLVYGLKDGTPLLPQPFTAAQLVELDERTGRVFSERIECGSDTGAVIAEMAQRSPASAELTRALLYGETPDEPARQTSSAPQKFRKHADLLTPTIEAAQRECQDSDSAQAVFLVLRSWATSKSPRAPLAGLTEDGHIKWRDSSDQPKELSSSALSKRLKRAAKAAEAAKGR